MASREQIDRIIERAANYATTNKHLYVTVEYLLWSLLHEDAIVDLLLKIGAKPNHIKHECADFISNSDSSNSPLGDNQSLKRTAAFTRVFQRALTQTVFSGSNELSVEGLLLSILAEKDSHAVYFLEKYGATYDKVVQHLKETTEQARKEEENPLKLYCRNLVEDSKDGLIDPVIGRETVIEDTIEILARRKKNNVIYVGEPGVGKTAVIEGIAKKISDGDVPEAISDKVIYSLDIGAMLAGTKFRGEFEERFKGVLDEVEKKENVILFIDEIHMIMGAGATQGSTIDASNMMKPLLAKGKLMCIGATTFDEFSQHMEKDHALMRRFQKYVIEEPTVEDSKRILAGLEKYYVEFHGIQYEPETLDMCVDMSNRYIHNKFLPDKAIDIMDAAGARAKLTGKESVSMDIIIETVAKLAKIPVSMISVKENEVIKHLNSRLKDVVFGQDEAIDHIVEAIEVAKSGLREENKPIGCFMFVGQTGTGKTHLAKKLAENLSTKLVRFDMSEYQEKHSVSKLIGAPPGYVGHGEGKMGEGQLIAEVEENPNCVLLIDEIEKAAPEVTQILLQVMDDARLTSSKGKIINFRDVIIIMTSNSGAAKAEKRGIGFHAETYNVDAMTETLKANFPPEFRNRLDAVVTFNRLDDDVLSMIVDAEIKKLNDLMKDKNVEVTLTTKAKQWFAKNGYDDAMGARPMKRLIQEQIKKPLSKEILYGKLVDGGNAVVDIDDLGDPTIIVREKALAVVEDEQM